MLVVFLITSPDCTCSVYTVSLFLRDPVKGRAAALGLEELMVQWRKPDLVGRKQIYEKTQRIHAE